MTLRLKPFLALFALLLLPVLGLTATPARADLIKQAATYTRTVLMTSTADHITGATGLTLVIKAAKAGGVPATITDTVTEQGSGRYAIALTTTDTNTLGALDLIITATGADPSDTHDQVIAFDPNDASLLGLTGVATATTQGTQGTTLGTINTQATGANTQATGANTQATTAATQATGANTQASTLLLSLATYQSTLTTGSTTTALNTALTGTADLTGGKVVFTAGVNKGVARTIASMNSGTGVITLLSAVPTTPGATDAFSVVQGSKVLEQFLAALGTDSRPVLSANTQPAMPVSNLPADYLSSAEQTALSGASVNTSTLVARALPPTAAQIQAYLDANSALPGLVWSVGTRTVTGGTIGTYTGNTPQTGDAYLRLASAVVLPTTAPTGYGGGASGDTSGVTTLLARIPGTVQPQTGDAFAAATAAPAATATALMNKPITGTGLTLGQEFVLLGLASVKVASIANTWNSTTHILTTAYSTTGGVVVLTTSAQYPPTQILSPALSGVSAAVGTVPQP